MQSDRRAYGNRWARLIPIAFITYSLAYLDRANYSFGAAAGMAADLHITEGASSLLGALFFLGYFFFQIPAAAYAERRSAKVLIFWSLLLWGVLASATGIITNITLLYIDRFLLGVMESVVLPGMLIFLSHWFTKSERSRANTFLILGNPVTVLWMSILSGYLAQSFGWRGMFIIEGLPPVIWAFCWWNLVEDRPAQAKWLDPAERIEVENKLEEEQRALPPVKNYAEAFRTPAVILLAIQYFCWSVGIYGFILWLPSMLKAGSTIGLVTLGWLSAAPYLLAVLLMIGCSFASDRLNRRKALIWPFLLIGAFALYGSYLIGASSFWLSFFLLVIAGGAMYAPYGPFFAFIAEILPRNVAGGAMALINSCGALGSFVGSYVVGWLNGATGGTGASFLFMSAAMLASALLTMSLRGRPAGLRFTPVGASVH
ncbi:MAG: MFS transporter [Acetobacteraceae bacterium]|nr:MFS transporter [Acetobacteraceae bacterium]MBV8526403.1 MFS transporter [Acetobacteraceae bacterium]